MQNLPVYKLNQENLEKECVIYELTLKALHVNSFHAWSPMNEHAY
jgi:hypothetical protein